MKKIEELFEKFKEKDDCEHYEFLDLYDSLLAELIRMESNHTMELKNMYNHEYATVKNWPRCRGSEQIYKKERKDGFLKMKSILKLIKQEHQCNN